MSVQLLLGDARERLAELPESSVDAVVCDPPYELGFMGKAWDSTGIAYDPNVWRECLRVLKPGGHLLAFGGSRTYHRLASAVEDAGFEIRDQIMWLYGQGFPKSHNVSKAIDKLLGAEREVIGHQDVGPDIRGNKYKDDDGQRMIAEITIAASPAAKQWDGWGTALKPAHEPIVVARKPTEGTVAQNVLKYGTGAMNILNCRVGTDQVPSNRLEAWSGFGELKRPDYTQTINEGRWPANVIHDGSDEVLAVFPDAPGQIAPAKEGPEVKTSRVYSSMKRGKVESAQARGDKGSAARFFYCAKAGRKDRNEGCEAIEPRFSPTMGNGIGGKEHDPETATKKLNHHPTVKPVELMRYLVRLVTPPGGVVLDPFMGSGSTGKAAVLEGMCFIGIDVNQEYVDIAEARIGHAMSTGQRVSAQRHGLGIAA